MDDTDARLGYTIQPISKWYRPKIQGKIKVRMPIDNDDAVEINDVMGNLGRDAVRQRWSDIEQSYRVLIWWYAKRYSATQLADRLNCSRATAYRRLGEARTLFREYLYAHRNEN